MVVVDDDEVVVGQPTDASSRGDMVAAPPLGAADDLAVDVLSEVLPLPLRASEGVCGASSVGSSTNTDLPP